MKSLQRMMLGLASLLLFTAGMCAPDEDPCLEAMQKEIQVNQAFLENQNLTNCEAWKAALKEFHESGCPAGAPYDQEYRNTLDCSGAYGSIN